MNYQIVLGSEMADELGRHLLSDRSTEQMAVVLCGLDRRDGLTRLLGRHLITLPPEAFRGQSAFGLELAPSVQQHILALAAREGLSQIDFHTHPGDGRGVAFSGIDDRSEQELAGYLAERLPNTVYASVVTNGCDAAARVWEAHRGELRVAAIAPPRLDGTQILGADRARFRSDELRYDRQIRAFGRELQSSLSEIQIGIVGAGGLGSVFVEQAARIGVRRWRISDPDIVETTNLNRLLGAYPDDVSEERAKVHVVARNIRAMHPDAEIATIRASVFTKRALNLLKSCDVLVAATDNDASRMVVNALAAQYLIPLIHLGVNLDVSEDGITDISGEVAVPPLGTWCLLCAGLIDAGRAAMDLASPAERALLRDRGYLAGVEAPAVYHLNSTVASLAVSELHNLVWPYRALRRYVVFRDLEGDLMTVNVPAGVDCPHCGPSGRLGLGDLAPLWRPQRRAIALPSIDGFSHRPEEAEAGLGDLLQ